ncbi:MAG: NAD(P)/FAD-dependent oxidoreductase [Clostridium sp.]|jgi:predicted Rossmann fold flavoprotein
MKQKRVIIIGAGASGMTAAIFAARQGARVTLLEHRDRVGKKILSTGNGRCNLSNRFQDASCYRSGVPDFPMRVISGFPLEMTLDFFEDIGVITKERDGYLYPYSGQASAVLDAFRLELEKEKIPVVTECEILRIIPEIDRKRMYRIETSMGEYSADCVVLATGGKAAPVTGSDGSGYRLARQLGHHIIKPLPALVQLRCRESFFRQIAGVRTEAVVTLYVDGKKTVSDHGELQLTDYGISGIPVFQVSRYAARALDQKERVEAALDFYPGCSRKKTQELLFQRAQIMRNRLAEDFFTGWLHKKLALLLLKCAGIRREERVDKLTEQAVSTLCQLIHDFRVEIKEVNPFEQAQICCGGVDVREVNPETMESRLHPGLFLAGELLDVDGICGGYNLQWAWSTGAIAGTHAGCL